MGKSRTIAGVCITAAGALALGSVVVIALVTTSFRGFGMEIGVREFWRSDPGFGRYFLAQLFRFPDPGRWTCLALVSVISGMFLLVGSGRGSTRKAM